VLTARILPSPLTTADTAILDVSTADPDGDVVILRIAWLWNGQVIEGERTATLTLRALKRGDRLGAELTPVDARGAAGPAYRVDPVEIANTPPVVSRVEIEPRVATPGERLHAKVQGTDADGDSVKYTFQWWRNGNPVAAGGRDEERTELPTEGFARGDSIVAGVTPHDASGPGKIVYAEPVVLANRAPVITSTPTAPKGQGAFEYVVTATDPDNDTLTYKLDTAPAGMTIDAATGRITWQMPSNLTGPQQVRVSADDGNQGRAFQEFTLAPPPAR
jgi:hypothetical protein